MSAMTTMGLDDTVQNTVFQIVSGIMWLGEIEFSEGEGGGGDAEGSSFSDETKEAAATACELLGLDVGALEMALTGKEITAGNETYRMKFAPTQANDAKEALAKKVYGAYVQGVVLCTP